MPENWFYRPTFGHFFFSTNSRPITCRRMLSVPDFHLENSIEIEGIQSKYGPEKNKRPWQMDVWPRTPAITRFSDIFFLLVDALLPTRPYN